MTVPTEVKGDAARKMWVIWGAGHQRSSAMSPSSRAHTTSYPPFIETMRLSSVPFRGIVRYLSAVATISYNARVAYLAPPRGGSDSVGISSRVLISVGANVRRSFGDDVSPF